MAYFQSMTFLKGCLLGSGIAATLVFAILPRATSFPSLCLAMGLALLPLGFLLARAKNPLFFFACTVNFLPMLSINNTISFDGTTSNPLFGQAQSALNGRIIELQARLRRPRTLHLTDDFRESALAFVEKRDPPFQSNGRHE